MTNDHGQFTAFSKGDFLYGIDQSGGARQVQSFRSAHASEYHDYHKCQGKHRPPASMWDKPGIPARDGNVEKCHGKEDSRKERIIIKPN
jgi:hypothetical protein